jgi:hypothetical protein
MKPMRIEPRTSCILPKSLTTRPNLMAYRATHYCYWMIYTLFDLLIRISLLYREKKKRDWMRHKTEVAHPGDKWKVENNRIALSLYKREDCKKQWDPHFHLFLLNLFTNQTRESQPFSSNYLDWHSNSLITNTSIGLIKLQHDHAIAHWKQCC